MKACRYKSVLAAAFEKNPLLPISANAHFGTVLHKLLELIVKGNITTVSEFDDAFEKINKETELKIAEQGFTSLLPLQFNVKDFGLKKVLLKKHLRENQGTGFGKSRVRSEKWLVSGDGLIGGVVDLIRESENCVEILDFKTGKVTVELLDDIGDNSVSIKPEYQNQLMLYAFLYFESYKRMPDLLTVVDISKQKYSFKASEESCREIYEEAKSLLKRTNSEIETREFIANPTTDNCRYCLYRPACSFYPTFLESTTTALPDIIGLIKEYKEYLNGNVSVKIESNGIVYSVNAFPHYFVEFFGSRIGKMVSIFNLKKELDDSSFSVIKSTMVYEKQTT